jgi:hypothetical protein
MRVSSRVKVDVQVDGHRMRITVVNPRAFTNPRLPAILERAIQETIALCETADVRTVELDGRTYRVRAGFR